jgi:hypothetical protein
VGFKEELTSMLSLPASGILEPDFDLEENPNGKVGGFVISNTFKGMAQIERQNLLWDYLDKKLSDEQTHHIVTLITVTPDEANED